MSMSKEHDTVVELQQIRKRILREDKFQKELSEKIEAALIGPSLDEEGTKQFIEDLRSLLKSVDEGVSLAEQFNYISNELGDIFDTSTSLKQEKSQVH